MSKVMPISGFPEFLPEEQIAFNKARTVVQKHFETFGFVPMETPAVERVDTLLAKGAEDKEIYGIRRLQAEDDGAKDLGLRFDLTVPLARYVAQHYGKLTFPYRRYHIAPVWRGERAQAGRYRQFYQCDIDVIGDESLSLSYDAEIPAIIYGIFKELNIGDFVIRLNNRKLLSGLLGHFGITNAADIAPAMRIIDDLEKLPQERILKDLSEITTDEQAEALLTLFKTKQDNHAWIEQLKQLASNPSFQEGVSELETVLELLKALKVPEENLQIDPSIARGLGYYTGTIYETQLTAYPELGSICSGGRYDNLAEKFTKKKLPGVGISIGLTRLIPKLIEAGLVKADQSSTADVLVTSQEQDHLAYYMDIATSLREQGLNVETYLEPKKLIKQFKYADSKGISFVIIANAEEITQDLVVVKNMKTGEQTQVKKSEITKTLDKFKLQKKF